MNAPSQRAETAALAAQPQQAYEIGPLVDSQTLILHGDYFDRHERLAKIMSKAKGAVPNHLLGNEGACFAVAMTATRAKFDHFGVARKTWIGPDGAIKYEAQLVIALINNSGLLKERLKWEYFGPWEKILGKFEWRESKRKQDDNGNPKKYIVKAWSDADEAGLGVRCIATLKGENAPRVTELLMAQAVVRNSTLWVEDPKQQIAYLSAARWGRLHTPEATMGIYTPEEDFTDSPAEKFMGPADVVPEKPKTYPDELFTANLPEWTKYIEAGRKTADQIIAMANTKFPLTDDQKKKVRAVKAKTEAPAAKPADTVQDAGPVVTFAQVADAIAKATDADKVSEAEDLIGAVADPQQRTELVALAKARREELAQ